MQMCFWVMKPIEPFHIHPFVCTINVNKWMRLLKIVSTTYIIIKRWKCNGFYTVLNKKCLILLNNF